MSVFVAIDPDDAVRHEVMSLTKAARERITAKWLPPHKLHLTVFFLGFPTPAQVPALFAPFDALAARGQPFALQLTGAGTFATGRAPSVLWLGAGGALEALEALHRSAGGLLGALSTTPPRTEPFRPHLTLARSPVPGALEPLASEYQAFTSAPFRVAHLTLYESHDGQFTALRTAALGG